MGLDMYALTTTEKPASAVDFDADAYSELHYWRKHPDLHGWMENLYREKGGVAQSFNCVRMGRPPKLDDAQLDQARERLSTENETTASIARELGVAPWTLTRSLRRQCAKLPVA